LETAATFVVVYTVILLALTVVLFAAVATLGATVLFFVAFTLTTVVEELL
jgi:hypothetical protein